MPYIPATIVLALFVVASTTAMGQTILIDERFDDSLMASRGWYDNTKIIISRTEHIPGGTGSAEYLFRQGAKTATVGGGIRRKIDPTQTVYLRYWVKYSANWEGSNKPYHPHEFHFITDVDDKYIGPAATHLTLYIEQNEGRPMLSIQDALNIDESRIGENLVGVTEDRGVAGCNGDSDGYGPGDCYLSGTTHRNGKSWKAPGIFFTDTTGPYYKNDWHRVEALFKINSIVNGKGVADGVVQYWYDGQPLIDHHDVILRTGAHPTMAFNQFLIAPYIGDGSPLEQTMWIDDLLVATDRLQDSGTVSVPNIPVGGSDGKRNLSIINNY